MLNLIQSHFSILTLFISPLNLLVFPSLAEANEVVSLSISVKPYSDHLLLQEPFLINVLLTNRSHVPLKLPGVLDDP